MAERSWPMGRGGNPPAGRKDCGDEGGTHTQGEEERGGGKDKTLHHLGVNGVDKWLSVFLTFFFSFLNLILTWVVFQLSTGGVRDSYNMQDLDWRRTELNWHQYAGLSSHNRRGWEGQATYS